ncbi:hypothetical protein HK100_008249, partial [Physocladia obscura]
LYLAAAYGVSSMAMSFAVGPITDFVANPTLIITVDAVFHLGALIALWTHPNPVNNLGLLYPVYIICAASDAILLNQAYKVIAGLFQANSTAYAAYKFHSSLMIGVAFFVSKQMLTSNGFPRMEIWVPLLAILFIGAIVGTYFATLGLAWKVEHVNDEVIVIDNPKVNVEVIEGEHLLATKSNALA